MTGTEGRRALITGITGQDGSYLAELLLGKGYEVHGLVRRLSVPNAENISGLAGRVVLHDGDLLDQTSLDLAVGESGPDEVYNLAAQSFVATSWKQPVLTGEITGLGAVRVLEAVRRFADNARFYQASSSEMFGSAPAPQNEGTALAPRSPYGFAKVYAHHAVRNYRESYGMFAATGILFNHESPRRGVEFVTRKISRWAGSVAAHRPYLLELGNLGARRDWGYAPDYVDLMWRILQHGRADDFVGATGETHTVGEFLEAAVRAALLPPDTTLRAWLRVNTAANVRPADVHDLQGDAARARAELGWSPTVTFDGLVRLMVRSDYERLLGRPALVGPPRPTGS